MQNLSVVVLHDTANMLDPVLLPRGQDGLSELGEGAALVKKKTKKTDHCIRKIYGNGK